MGADGEVAGFAVADDLTARDLQRAERQWTRAKGFDGSCPFGPWITTADEVAEPATSRCRTSRRRAAPGLAHRDLVFGVPRRSSPSSGRRSCSSPATSSSPGRRAAWACTRPAALSGERRRRAHRDRGSGLIERAVRDAAPASRRRAARRSRWADALLMAPTNPWIEKTPLDIADEGGEDEPSTRCTPSALLRSAPTCRARHRGDRGRPGRCHARHYRRSHDRRPRHGCVVHAQQLRQLVAAYWFCGSSNAVTARRAAHPTPARGRQGQAKPRPKGVAAAEFRVPKRYKECPPRLPRARSTSRIKGTRRPRPSPSSSRTPTRWGVPSNSTQHHDVIVVSFELRPWTASTGCVPALPVAGIGGAANWLFGRTSHGATASSPFRLAITYDSAPDAAGSRHHNVARAVARKRMAHRSATIASPNDAGSLLDMGVDGVIDQPAEGVRGPAARGQARTLASRNTLISSMVASLGEGGDAIFVAVPISCPRG